MDDKSHFPETIDYIHHRMRIVKQYGLEIEVIVFALRAMKQNPKLTVVEAFECGCDEWDC